MWVLGNIYELDCESGIHERYSNIGETWAPRGSSDCDCVTGSNFAYILKGSDDPWVVPALLPLTLTRLQGRDETH